MRIIAGQRRGHKIDGPTGRDTRPTSDLVRESIFNILGEAVADRVVYDLFAGTGALGLEALSRGAARAVFVERDRSNVALIRRNVATLRYEDRASIVPSDAFRWARSIRADEPVVVLLDPPYRVFEERPKMVRQAVEGLLSGLPAGSVVVLESRSKLDPDLLPEFDAWDLRRYGGTQVAFRTVGEAGAVAEDEAPGEAPGLPA